MEHANTAMEQYSDLFRVLEERFTNNMHRHCGLVWADVQGRLLASPHMLPPLHAMEVSGGEPDVIVLEGQQQGYSFCDCSPESPAGRRSLCYDQAALASRKLNKPQDSALGLAAAMGIEVLTEEEYHQLQRLDSFDLKSSSWIKTPEAVRSLGGALFGDRRYNRVFFYHNGAESYYAGRGFRGVLRV